jgi:hypothetical protein
MALECNDTLFLLVTCSMDTSRQLLADRVATNLVAQNRNLRFFQNLVVFDNASRYETDPALLQNVAVNVRARENVGYWSAINWTLEHHEELLGRSFSYIYIIESDLIHYDMNRLAAAERFLDDTDEAGAVRTQEFSVRYRILYNKRWARLPFAKRRSWVAQYNAVTGEPVWFRKQDPAERIYLSNFHTKLPALNRLDAVRDIFSELRRIDRFTEMDFIRAYHTRHPLVGLLDGGIFRSYGNDSDEQIVTGSYSDSDHMKRIGYQPTREAEIGDAEVDVLHSPVGSTA